MLLIRSMLIVIVGLLVLLLGVQFRVVESYVLNERTNAFINRQMASAAGGSAELMRSVGPAPKRTISPPPWLGWALISIGSVLVLHSLSMPKPAG